VCGWQVKLCDPLVTRGPYLSTLEIWELIIKRYINLPSLLYFTQTISAFTPQLQGVTALWLVLIVPTPEGMARLS